MQSTLQRHLDATYSVLNKNYKLQLHNKLTVRISFSNGSQLLATDVEVCLKCFHC